MEKPGWKIEAERIGESLPEYFSLQELSKITEIDSSYLFRLLKKYFIPSYKIGTVRFISLEQANIFLSKLKKF